MDRLPVDIWNHIFFHACTDGGRTGAALASTSHFLSTASAPYRFHSLKLAGLAQIGKLLLCYERMGRASSRPPRLNEHAHNRALGARHLLLAFLPGECDAPARPWRGWSEYSRKKHKREGEIVEDELVWENSKAAWDRQFEYLVPRLFHLVAPTLETLAVLQHSDIALPYAGGHFPRLRELSLLADDRLFVRPEPHWTTAVGTFDHEELARFWNRNARSPPFPALTHLHIVYEGPKQVPWEKTLALWGKLAPAVTHVRVSQASKLMPEVLDDIATRSFAQAQALGKTNATATPSGTSSGRQRVSFPKLHRAIVQPFVLEPVRGHEHLEEVRTLRAAPRSRGPVVVVMRGRWYRDGYWRDRLRWEWEARMVAGPGCWAEREDDEGEWAYERRKRAEVAVAKARVKNLTVRPAVHARVLSMIHLDEDYISGLSPLKVATTKVKLRGFIGLGRKRSMSH